MKTLATLSILFFFAFGLKAQEGEKTVTESGLTYIKLKEGTGQKVNNGDKVKIWFVGRLSNGKVFDQTPKGAKFVVGDKGVIPGFNEALTLMSLEERAKFILPPNLGYGEKGSKDMLIGEHTIPPNETISFEILVMKIY
jgi:FKBP-type peptidyl-prolyl cis-trans isomerase